MNSEKPARFVIYGAGAVGSVIAGLLNRAGVRTTCVARPAYAEALERGVLIRQNGDELRIGCDAVTAVDQLKPEHSDVVLITTKSQATEQSVNELAAVYEDRVPVVCLQNGARNEEVVARRFRSVYAGLVFFSAVQLDPTVISLPQGRTVAIGCYPEGLDPTAQLICDKLLLAGLDAHASAYVMAMKWGKLVANLNNATCAITGYWLEQALADATTRRFMSEVREEGLRVLDAAGIEVEPPPGEPSPIRIREMNARLKGPPKQDHDPESLPFEKRTYASMWQDLRVGRQSGETAFLNGEIVALGEKLAIPTPYNSTLLDVATRMFEQRCGPGLCTPAELTEMVRSRMTRG